MSACLHRFDQSSPLMVLESSPARPDMNAFTCTTSESSPVVVCTPLAAYVKSHYQQVLQLDETTCDICWTFNPDAWLDGRYHTMITPYLSLDPQSHITSHFHPLRYDGPPRTQHAFQYASHSSIRDDTQELFQVRSSLMNEGLV